MEVETKSSHRRGQYTYNKQNSQLSVQTHIIVMSRDIRHFLTPTRRRRIVTDDDDSDTHVPVTASALPIVPAPPMVTSALSSGTRADPVMCDDSPQDDEEGNEILEPGMAILMLPPISAASENCSKPQTGRTEADKSVTLNKTPHNQPTFDKPQCIESRPDRRSKTNSKRKYRKSTPQRLRRRVAEDEAIESEASTDRRTCEESDDQAKSMFPDASELYRSSILGVRNKSSALQDMRAATIVCPICARFAEFLKFFKT
jgi:hypothetical protein